MLFQLLVGRSNGTARCHQPHLANTSRWCVPKMMLWWIVGKFWVWCQTYWNQSTENPLIGPFFPSFSSIVSFCNSWCVSFFVVKCHEHVIFNVAIFDSVTQQSDSLYLADAFSRYIGKRAKQQKPFLGTKKKIILIFEEVYGNSDTFSWLILLVRCSPNQLSQLSHPFHWIQGCKGRLR